MLIAVVVNKNRKPWKHNKFRGFYFHEKIAQKFAVATYLN